MFIANKVFISKEVTTLEPTERYSEKADGVYHVLSHSGSLLHFNTLTY